LEEAEERREESEERAKQRDGTGIAHFALR
jgi:hypothetical protein